MGRWADIAWELGRAVYSLGLLALGVMLLRALPAAGRVLRGLTVALSAAADGLKAFVAQGDALERIERQGRENAEALRRIEASVAPPAGSGPFRGA